MIRTVHALNSYTLFGIYTIRVATDVYPSRLVAGRIVFERTLHWILFT